MMLSLVITCYDESATTRVLLRLSSRCISKMVK